MRPAAPYGDLRGRDGPLTPSPLTVPATMKDRGGEGVEDMGDGGSFAPPIPQEFPPLPLHDSRGRETQREQGEALGVREASTFLRLLAARLPNRARDGAGSLRPRVGLRWLRPRPCGAAAS